MFDGVPAHWQEMPGKAERSPNKPAYVFLGIMLAGLAAPAVIICWSIYQGVSALLH